MYKRISGVKWLILPCVTFGIYALVVWVRMTRNYNRIAAANGKKTIMCFIPQLLLGCITFGIVPIVWMFKFYGLMCGLNRDLSAGVSPSNGFVMFLMSCIPFYSYFWLAKAHNQIVSAAEAAAQVPAA